MISSFTDFLRKCFTVFCSHVSEKDISHINFQTMSICYSASFLSEPLVCLTVGLYCLFFIATEGFSNEIFA